MTKREKSEMKSHPAVDPQLYRDVAQFGAKDMETCMQCGACSASCPLSTGTEPFPRKIYRYLQLGLKEKLLRSPVPWLCYYCGECNKECPRGAEPAETMMAARRWLTAQYDWTGLARRFYLSEAWEIGALGVVAFAVIMLFVLFHGPIVTDRVSVNSFAPVKWIEIGDLLMAAGLSAFLLSNAFRMFRFVMGDAKVPVRVYITQAKEFVLHFLTQKRWRQCGEDRSRWLKHFILVTGYLTMMTLVIVFIRWFQVDDSSWHFTSIFGYYATAVLLYITVEMFRSRLRKQETIHRFSELSDWLFLILLFATALTGIVMHTVRLAGWPMGTYVSYVVHLAVAVPMLVIEVPFGKWSHLFYRPLAAFLTTVKSKAATASRVSAADVALAAGETFLTCLHCGNCASICPWAPDFAFNPRRIMRQVAMASGTERSVDQAVWRCVTCNACGVNCPRGIDIIGVMQAVRKIEVDRQVIPECFEGPLDGLAHSGNPWSRPREKRLEWAADLQIPPVAAEHEYGLFTCCTAAYDPGNRRAARALPRLLDIAGVTFGTFGTQQSCCGDLADNIGAKDLFSDLVHSNTEMIAGSGAAKVLTTSPHCLHTFKTRYPEPAAGGIEHSVQLLDRLIAEKRLQPSRRVERIVTYHDPCYLGRHEGIYEAPRRILKRIPGLTLVEMPNNREQSSCCGGGGGGAWSNEPPAQGLGAARVRQALLTGAEAVATACPYCIRMLKEAVAELGVGDRLAVFDTAELLLASLEPTDESEVAADAAVKQEAYDG